MSGETRQLLDFIEATNYQTLTPEVAHESKRIFMDSIGAAIAALKSDKGRYSMALAERFGGPAESAIIGTDKRISCVNAAFANGELINALDYDAVIFPTHAPPSVIPAALAIGETVGASGKEIILATTLGCEISIRLAIAIRGLKRVFATAEGSEVGKIAGTKHSVSAIPVVVVGGAAGAGKILKLNPRQMANAIGLAGHFTPIPQARWRQTPRMPMPKYLSSGWASMAEVTAVLLAQSGYTADTTFLDGELGFWRFFGGDMWDPNALSEDLGREWKMLRTVSHKPYPCCMDFHVGLDCLYAIIEENKLTPSDITKIKIQTNPVVTRPIHMNKVIDDHIDAQFSMPFCIAAAAHRVSLAEWQDPESMKNASILDFMNRIEIEAHPRFLEVQAREPGSILTSVDVTTAKGTFTREGKFSKGFSGAELTRLSDDDLVRKFKANASKALSPQQVDRAAVMLMELEKVPNISELVNMVTL